MKGDEVLDIKSLNTEKIIKLIMLRKDDTFSDYPITRDKTYIELENEGFICNLKSGFPNFTKEGQKAFEEYYESIEGKILEHYNPKKDFTKNSYLISQKTGNEEKIVYNVLISCDKIRN